MAARDADWTHEDYLAAVLEREVSARNNSGAELRIRAAEAGLQPHALLALASGAYVAEHRNIVPLGPPGTGKTDLATGLGIRACQAGCWVLVATATNWITRRGEAHAPGKLVRLATTG